ncbi:hypothetical protein BJY24_005562 [Nocardia transvalensis]|uniref:Uncharacterized protein n=1 Tax=Nocardia transvalensis TaxID=37333 RepID=A0A7W9ULF7_9NOCA|nr:hypothetical protein [Nocardia transvalensis]
MFDQALVSGLFFRSGHAVTVGVWVVLGLVEPSVSGDWALRRAEHAHLRTQILHRPEEPDPGA